MRPDTSLLLVLDRMGCGAVLVDDTGQFISANKTSESIINEFNSSNPSAGSDLRQGFKYLISKSDYRFVMDSESWFVVRQKDRKPIAVYSMPLSNSEDKYKESVMIIVDMERSSTPNTTFLQKLFNLSNAEAIISVLILEGNTPVEISKIRGISLWTIRTHLASIYAKTKTRRQSELVSLLLKISMLP